MYEQFNEHYPKSMPEKIPFNEDTLLLYFLVSREIHGGPPEHYTLSSKSELEAELCTLDLQLAYVDIYCNDLIIYTDIHVEQSDSENIKYVKKVFLVYKHNKAVLSFATPYKSVPRSELTSK